MPAAFAHDIVLLSSSSSPPHIPDSDIISTPPHLRHEQTSPLPPFSAHAQPHARPFESPLALRGSSPSLPSPSALFKRPPPPQLPQLPGLKSGSRAARIPDGMAFGFASAGALVRERVLSLEEEKVEDGGQDTRDGSGEGAGGPAKTRKRAAKKADREGNEAGTKKARRGKKKDDVPPVVDRVEGTEVSNGREDTTAVETGGAERPKGRKSKAVLNNSELIRDALGLESAAEAPQSKPRAGGAVEKLKKRKAKNDPAQVSATPLDSGASTEIGRFDSSLDQSAQVQPVSAQKMLEKKPRARKTKKPNDDPAEAPKDETVAKTSKPSKKQPTVRKRTKTVLKHFSPDNLVDAQAPKANEAPAPVKNPDEPLDLPPATIRRRSWTPLKDTKSSPNGNDSLKPVDLCESPSEKTPAVAGTKPSFTELLNGFEYSAQAPGSTGAVTLRTESGEAFTKRRKLELVEKPNQPAEVTVSESVEEPPKKPGKAPKKKPRTITDLVTAAYRPPAPAEVSESHKAPIDPKVSAFFAPPAEPTSGTERAAGHGAEKPKRASRSKSPTKKTESKAKKPTAKSKKAAKLVAEKLLSPESALLRVNRQDVLFGTSSQLAREESPTFIRDLQQAIRDSETLGSQKSSLETLHLKPAVSGSGLSLMGRRKGLWAAASRDLEDGILEEEEASTIQDGGKDIFVEDNMEFMPDDREKALSPTQDQTAATYVDPNEQPTQQPQMTSPADEDLIDEVIGLPEAPSGLLVEDDAFESFPSAQPNQPSSDYIDIDEYDRQLSQRPTSSTLPTSHSTSQLSPTVRRTALQPLVTRPNIPLLSKSVSDVSSNRGKATMATKAAARSKKTISEAEAPPTKRPRGRPRKSVEPEERTQQGLGEDTLVTQVTSPTKRPRGRPPKAAVEEKSSSRTSSPEKGARSKRTTSPSATPKKRTTKTKAADKEEWPDIDEIEDSQEEISPSPRRHAKAGAIPEPLTLTPSQEEPGMTVIPEGPAIPDPIYKPRKSAKRERVPLYYLEDVFLKVTSAVKACPPSDDAVKPSWHEKMLLYDPIVAEDLAKWLNDQGIQMVVDIPVVEKKRKKKAAEDDDNTPVNEITFHREMQELPAWVVQKWCEENSVCCIPKESLWKGGRRARR
ncbi:Structure-specific endonuclease subunit SLX4 [Lasiodiplodia theobromae]|uniref:Structure-specific endonuclease subunit SLX4 n=1 Tax=Lasiodiplodia theobromae TaxID=45133 RepID=A0A5N5DTQ6_9PEZI|nr:Structure-specific endonuclease subunit SLX4 [Lasiodiplodia theobromae]